MFENLPIDLTQQEERLLRTIVAPESAKRRGRRRNAILVALVGVAMLGAVWGLFYVPMSDLSEYESLADTAFAVLSIGIILGNSYFFFRIMRLQEGLIQKFFAKLSSADESKDSVDPTDA